MVVIGAGIVGCAVARELTRRGARCTVIDSRPVAGGATQASAGMLAPYVEAHERGPMLDLCVRSLDLYDEWINGLEEDGEAVEYRRIGTLQIALTASQADHLRHGAGEWLERSAVAAIVPGLSPTAGALLIPVHGYVDAPGLTRALAHSAERRGARFVSAHVERIDRRAEGLTVAAGEERIDADAVVIAAGAWTSRIAGVRTPPLRPVRGQLLHVRCGVPVPTILWGPDCYIVPHVDGTLLVGATVEDAGFDERTTAEGVEGLLAAVRSLLPGVTPQSLIEARVGLRPATPDELPVLGADPEVPGLFHASGHYRNGVLLAPVTAQVMADLILDGKADSGLNAFRPDRF